MLPCKTQKFLVMLNLMTLALVLSPGYLNDYTNAFTWIPFDCEEVIPCALYTHLNDHRESTKKFLNTLLSVYQNKSIV